MWLMHMRTSIHHTYLNTAKVNSHAHTHAHSIHTTHTCTHIHMLYMYTHTTHTHTHTDTHTHNIYTYTYTHTDTHTCTNMYIHINTHKHTHMHQSTVPSAPINLEVVNKSSENAIEVSWDAPEVANGILLPYVVSYYAYKEEVYSH